MRSSLTLAALAVALCSAAPLAAQATMQAYIPLGVDSVHAVADSLSSASSGANTVESSAAVSGASLTGMRAAVHKAGSRGSLQPTMMATHGNLGQARAMMVVGVAGLIAGAIIGGTPGTIIMVGGTVVGLVGLYEYLQ